MLKLKLKDKTLEIRVLIFEASFSPKWLFIMQALNSKPRKTLLALNTVLSFVLKLDRVFINTLPLNDLIRGT